MSIARQNPPATIDPVRAARLKYVASLTKRYGDDVARWMLEDTRFLGVLNALSAHDLSDGGGDAAVLTDHRSRLFATLVATFISGAKGREFSFTDPALRSVLVAIEFGQLAA